jgi:SAM-dependent methyltransferase
MAAGPEGATPVFPPGFFDRADPTPDERFYAPTRLVTHIDDGAIAAVGALYEELAVGGDVLDLMGSWVSHFPTAPRSLTVLGMNAVELEHNPQATATVVHDLNTDPRLPFGDGAFDDAVCCVSVDYLVDPVAVFRDVARVLRPGGRLVCTFSNRCFPTKAVRGWLEATDEQRCGIVAAYFRAASAPSGPVGAREAGARDAGTWEEPVVQTRVPPRMFADPLFAVWSRSVHSTV